MLLPVPRAWSQRLTVLPGSGRCCQRSGQKCLPAAIASWSESDYFAKRLLLGPRLLVLGRIHHHLPEVVGILEGATYFFSRLFAIFWRILTLLDADVLSSKLPN